MRRRRHGTRLALLLGVAAASVLAGLFAYAASLLPRIEQDTYDQRVVIRGESGPPDGLVVVAIDDVSFDELGVQWPFPRSLHARVVDRIAEAGAATIVYDVQFTEPSDPDEDLALFDAVAEAGNVVLGTSEVDEDGGTAVLGGDEALAEAGAVAGNAQFEPDSGGVIRRVPYATDGLESLAVRAVERTTGERVDPGELGSDGALIDYHGPPGTVETISFSSVVEGSFDPALLRDAIVVIGASAPSLQDTHPTPTSGSELMPGPEIQANAISTALRDFPLRSAPGGLDALMIVLLGLVAPAASLRLTGLQAVGVALAAVFAFAVAAQLAFNAGLVVSVIYPIGTALLAAFGVLSVHYLTEVRERRRTRAVFARFVPTSVVDQVLAQAEDGVRLGGEERYATVLFSDVRGFTTFSEETPAPQVIEVLNRYLTGMSEAILDHGGTLVSYLGDGILAVFGAPIDQPDHADRALATAREMIGPRLQEFNRWARLAGGIEEGFQIGVGINTGPLMAGNVGSDQRLEYTVIGDTVNTASRLEGLTKGSGYPVYVAEETRRALVGEVPDLVEVGEVSIRGRQATMGVWALAGPHRHLRASTAEPDPSHLESPVPGSARVPRP